MCVWPVKATYRDDLVCRDVSAAASWMVSVQLKRVNSCLEKSEPEVPFIMFYFSDSFDGGFVYIG